MLPTPAMLDSAEMRLWLRLVVTVGVIAGIFLAARWHGQRSRSEHGAEVHPDRVSKALGVSEIQCP
jgi:hypothetical protein